MDLAPDFRDLLEELARDGVEVVLVGGYAVSFHGGPRATKHIDLVLRGDSANLERASRALARFGAQLDDVHLKVIALDDLIVNKRAAGRPQALLDAELLERGRLRRRPPAPE